MSIFHLAFPIHNIDEARKFYGVQLGCDIGRASSSAIIFKLGGHQIVGHKVDHPTPEQSSIYPRHFGLIFNEKSEMDQFIKRVEEQRIPIFVPVNIRFEGTSIEHFSLFLKDPSNNLLEFKYYTHSEAIFGEKTCREVGESAP